MEYMIRNFGILSSQTELKNIRVYMWDKIISKNCLITKPRVQKDVLKKGRENIWAWPHCTLYRVWACGLLSSDGCVPVGHLHACISRQEFAPLREWNK